MCVFISCSWTASVAHLPNQRWKWNLFERSGWVGDFIIPSVNTCWAAGARHSSGITKDRGTIDTAPASRRKTWTDSGSRVWWMWQEGSLWWRHHWSFLTYTWAASEVVLTCRWLWNRRCLVRQKKKKEANSGRSERGWFSIWAGWISVGSGEPCRDTQQGWKRWGGCLGVCILVAPRQWAGGLKPETGSEVLEMSRWETDRVGQWECLEEGSPGGDGEGAETKGFPDWVTRRGGLSGRGDLWGRGGLR